MAWKDYGGVNYNGLYGTEKDICAYYRELGGLNK